MNKNISLVTGFAIGAACMYALDPAAGRRRRALAKDKLTRGMHMTGDRFEAAARDWSNRAAGTVAVARRRFRRDRPDDDVVVERVRAALGREVSHPRAIDVEVWNGMVRLSGPVLSSEVNSVLRAVESVPGVRNIDNRLEPHDQPGNIPALQGGSEPVTQW